MSGDEIIEIEKSSPKSIPGPVIIDINKLGNDIKEGFLEYQKNEHQNKLKITETTLQPIFRIKGLDSIFFGQLSQNE